MKKKYSKTVFITGAAKRIGAKIATYLASLGFNVIVHYYKSETSAKKLCTSINKNKEMAYCVKADLLNNKELKKAFLKGINKFGKIDCLINNASIFEYDNLKTLKNSTWNSHITANLSAPLFLSKLFYEFLPKNTKGDIINIIDQRVLNITPHFLSYTIAKSGLWTLTKSLALELAPNIKVNAIGPGPVIKSKFQSEKEFLNQCKKMPLKIGSNPLEIAKTVEFILSIQSMTGQIITLDGGQHLGWGQVESKSTNKD
ncbi:MAG: short chain dehydrogenase [Rickettsiales bacterium]|nr:short chain dehydrogenase [Rickettsiales bacterium]